MIDTMKIVTQATIDKETLKKMNDQHPSKLYRYKEGNQYTCYQYRINNDPYQPLVKYTVETQKLSIIIPSVPRFMFGSSLIPMNEQSVSEFLARLEGVIKSELDVQFYKSPSEWEIEEVDICYDFFVGADVSNYITALKQIHIQNYKEGNYRDETVYWRCSSKEIKFYDKYKQCLSEKSDEDTLLRSRGILRFEVNIKSQELIREFNSKLLGDVLSKKNINLLLEKHLSLLGLWDGIITNEHEIFLTLQVKYGLKKAVKYLGYLRLKVLGIAFDLPQRTKYNYLRDISDAGLLAVIAEKRLPPLRMSRNDLAIEKDNPGEWNFSAYPSSLETKSLLTNVKGRKNESPIIQKFFLSIEHNQKGDDFDPTRMLLQNNDSRALVKRHFQLLRFNKYATA